MKTRLCLNIIACILIIFNILVYINQKNQVNEFTTITKVEYVTVKDTVVKEVYVKDFFPIKTTDTVYIDTTTEKTVKERTLVFNDNKLNLEQVWVVMPEEDSLKSSNYSIKDTVITITDSVFVNKTIHSKEIIPQHGVMIGASLGYNDSYGWKSDIEVGYQFKTGWVLSLQGTVLDKKLFLGPKIQKVF